MSEYIKTMEKILNINSTKKQTNHNKPKVDSIQNNYQSGSEPKRAKSPETTTRQNLSNKKIITPQENETKRLNIFTVFYNPKNHTINFIG